MEKKNEALRNQILSLAIPFSHVKKGRQPFLLVRCFVTKAKAALAQRVTHYNGVPIVRSDPT